MSKSQPDKPLPLNLLIIRDHQRCGVLRFEQITPV